MYWIGEIALILHILSAALWFGAGIRQTGQIRAAVDAGGEAGSVLAGEIESIRRIVLYAMGGTLVFSVVTLVARGGFGAYGPRFHISLGLVLVMALVEAFLIQPVWKRVRASLVGEGEEELSSSGRIAMYVGINHFLWLVVLVLMVWGRT
jgi:uncharacterized protein YjeT (DUF2065 family)